MALTEKHLFWQFVFYCRRPGLNWHYKEINMATILALAAHRYDSQPGRCYDLLYGKDYALCTTFWSDQGGEIYYNMETPEVAGLLVGHMPLSCRAVEHLGASEHTRELIYTYYPAQNGNDSGGGGGEHN